MLVTGYLTDRYTMGRLEMRVAKLKLEPSWKLESGPGIQSALRRARMMAYLGYQAVGKPAAHPLLIRHHTALAREH